MPSIRWFKRDLGLIAVFGLPVHGRAVHRIATRWIAAISPIQHAVNWVVMSRSDRLWKVVVKNSMYLAISGRLGLEASACWPGRFDPIRHGAHPLCVR